MNIHEYQAKQILGRFGVPVPKGQLATTPDDAATAFTALGQPKAVVKAQIHAGGRGKAGGVRLHTMASEVRDFAAKLLGKPLVTHQTGPEGRVVRRVYIEEASDVARELYLGMLVDRKAGTVSVIASTEGGMDIEEVASKTPDKILTEQISPLLGVSGFQARKIAFSLGLKDKQVGQFATLLASLYRAFVESDASLIEINPLVVTKDGRVICLDAKMSFDDGGGASTEKVAAAFRILLADKRVKGVLINIFGGIMRCDVLAQGVVEAAKQVKLNVPLVVRMEGTNVVEGKKILAESGIKAIAASDMADAAKRIVKEIGA